jgi:ribonuclease P protein component
MPGPDLRTRLRRADFLRVTRLGHRAVTGWFLVFTHPRQDAGEARLGITVTRKVGRAVRRNRIKRLVREWFRRRKPVLGACDVVVIAKRDIPEDLCLASVMRDLDRALADAPGSG